MKAFRDLLDKQKPLFEKGGKLEKFYYLYEAGETFMFTPNHVTGPKGAQIRDANNLKRYMMTVVIAMIPCLLFGIWNMGYQHFLAVGEEPEFWPSVLLGAELVIPIVLVAYVAGGLVEGLFAVVRKHPINEGFLVTGMLIPLIMPVTIPLWQVALATIFSVVIAKEVFGGTGMNVLNVAMTARAFLYFAYPTDISGDVWTYYGDKVAVEGYTGATPLAVAAQANIDGEAVTAALDASWFGQLGGYFEPWNLFLGAYPDSIGASSVLMCLVGAFILILTGVGSWKLMLSTVLGAYVMGLINNIFAVNTFMEMPAYYHILIGGLAFGAVFMVTDPVSAAHTETGKWIYGFLIGVLTVIIRVFNPAYPEGIMLAVLLMNVLAPLIDHYVVEANKKRRLKRGIARATV
ncbi:NADH:ubiquinone reductase (Na(+)-transporting) subunit B [Cesiribacter sp. SM1]|uniref:NADH:ubiquinone reductase (Na(+)-transporting) subunit B n=1 Tax=Cesiribacter sp. SM1 TaxID=2861196 RepID=UPI001CD666AB|nr:NADH:ubiquinone reductase (Na(+)-transporting) subunit B [Cesiribacter sp. SM1]